MANRLSICTLYSLHAIAEREDVVLLRTRRDQMKDDVKANRDHSTSNENLWNTKISI